MIFHSVQQTPKPPPLPNTPQIPSPKHHPDSRMSGTQSPCPQDKSAPNQNLQGNEKSEPPPKGPTTPKTQEMKPRLSLIMKTLRNPHLTGLPQNHDPKEAPLCGKFALSNE